MCMETLYIRALTGTLDTIRKRNTTLIIIISKINKITYTIYQKIPFLEHYGSIRGIISGIVISYLLGMLKINVIY